MLDLALAVDISTSIAGNVMFLTSRVDFVSNKFVKVDSDSGQICKSDCIGITSDYKTGIAEADVVFITLPSFLVESYIEGVSKYSPKIIVFVPGGYGGKKYYCKELIENGCLVAGFDRSPYVGW